VKPENIGYLLHATNNIPQAESFQAAKAALMEVLGRDKAELGVKCDDEKEAIFNDLWSNLIPYLTEPLVDTEKSSIATTAVHLVSCEVDGERQDFAVSFRLQSRRGHPGGIETTWYQQSLPEGAPAILTEFTDTFYLNWAWRELCYPNVDPMHGLSSVATSVSAYLASDRELIPSLTSPVSFD
jgi:hypothetical protein